MPHYSIDDSRSKMLFEVMGVNTNHGYYLNQLKDVYHLFSFAYKEFYEQFSPQIDTKHIIIDSGGFSINNMDMKLDINDYIKFLKQARYSHAFNFDIIGNPEQTYTNQQHIENNNLQVIPVFHLGSPYKHLQKYINEGYTYISLGNMVGKHKTLKHHFLKKCFTIGQENGTKFHGLGLGHKYCAMFPLYSIDNSNHIMVRRNGQMNINGRKFKIPRVQGNTKEEKRWNDAKPVIIQLQENIKQYKETVKNNWLIYYKYFNDKVTMEEVLG